MYCAILNMLPKIPASMLSTTQVLHRDPTYTHKDAYSNDVQCFGAQFTDLSVLVIHQLQQIVPRYTHLSFIRDAVHFQWV